MTSKRKLLNSQEAAEYLGLSLSYFRKMMMRRIIPMYKPNGKLCFFDPDDLDIYLTSVRICQASCAFRRTKSVLPTASRRGDFIAVSPCERVSGEAGYISLFDPRTGEQGIDELRKRETENRQPGETKTPRLGD